jgi:outer membrane protein assembly factor BamB/subtilisin family serine protease
MASLRFHLWPLLLSAAVAAAAGPAAPRSTANSSFTPGEQSQGYVNGRVLVKLRSDVADVGGRSQNAESRAGITNRRSFQHLIDLHVLEFDRTRSVVAVAKELRATGLYEFVETDRIIHPFTTPNDPSFNQQWSLNNSGQSSGVVGADIGATAAWDLRSSAPNVVVAVIDSGIRATHVDLAPNLWTNPSPSSAYSGTDLHGINATVTPATGSPDDDETDGHGSHVSGIIGAVGNNAIGIAGVAWNVQLMALKFIDSTDTGSLSAELICLDYAIAHKVAIINGSFGSIGYSSSEFAALKKVRDAGIIVVVAAGNDGVNLESDGAYPAGYLLDNIVTVAATTRTDTLASFSNFSSGLVDLAAPGSEILSTVNTSDTAYAVHDGTSMAAPLVTGALALMKAHFPNDTYRQLINRLLRSTTKLPALTGKVQSGGRLNLFNVLSSTDNRPFNDDFATRAQLVGPSIRVRSSNVGATREPGEPTHASVAGGASLWWTWTAPVSGTVAIDTVGSSYDTAVAVYTGSSLGTLQLVGSNDDAATGINTSRLLLNVTAGTTYQIASDGKNGASGFTVLKVGIIPQNDSFANAQLVGGTSLSVVGSTLNASIEAGEPKLGTYAAGHSIWYRWIAPVTGHFQLGATSPMIDLIAGVYSGSAVSGLTLIASNDDSVYFNLDSLVSFDATAGQIYYFAIDNANPEGGDFALTLNDSFWQFPAGYSVYSSPAVGADGTVYFGSDDGFVYAANPDGSSKWSLTATGVGATGGPFIDTASPAIGPDGTVYMGSSDSYFYAFDGSTGVRRWLFPATSGITSTPAIATDGTIYFHDDNALYAITSGPTRATRKWSFLLNGGTYCSPAIATDGTIYLGTLNGVFYAVNPNGTQKWVFLADGDIYTSPAVAGDGTIYFATLSGSIYAVNPDGTQKWRWRVPGNSSVTSSPSLGADGTLYFGGYDHKLHALRSNGTEAWSYALGDEVRASSPAIGSDGTVYLGCYDALLYAVNPNGTLQRTFTTAGLIRSSPMIANNHLYFGSTDCKLYAFTIGKSAAASAWPVIHQNALHTGRAVTQPTISAQPVSQTASAGATLTLSVTATANSSPSYQWLDNGANLTGATSSSLSLVNVQPANAGLYAAVATCGATATSDLAIVGVATTSKVIGAGEELQPTDIHHPNGNVFDQVLLEGTAETITADANQITRTSYIDLNDDIVQIEFTGAGTLSLVLDNPSGPALPVNYNQAVNYMKGHAGIVITNANETTNVSIFSVGRINAFDPTGGFNLLLPVGATNNPANNGSSLFQGHATTAYDGVADIAFIAISTTNGKFGGLRASDANCFATKGLTGIYAPGVQFTGPVFISDINATGAATPVLIIGSSPDTRITGGDLLQANGQPVKVTGLTQLKFTAGGTSNNAPLPAQTNKAVLQQNGIDVTAQIVVNPTP